MKSNSQVWIKVSRVRVKMYNCLHSIRPRKKITGPGGFVEFKREKLVT